MRIRVLWLIKGLGPGGAEVLLAAAAEAHDHEAFDIECAFVLPGKDHLAERLERTGVRCHCLSTKDRDRLWLLRLRRLMTERPFDVVHAHSPLPAAVGRLVANSVLPRPALISTEHNAWATFATPTRWANRLTAGFDDAVFAVSEETRTSMSRRTAQRARTLRHGIDVDSTASQAVHRDAVRTELGIGLDDFVVGTVANYREQKDYPNLLRAAAVLDRQKSPIRIVAVGQGQLESEIVSLSQELGLRDRVLLTGWRPDATRVMSAFDVFTLASRWEGLPVALMEALALGLPVVATSVGGVAEELGDEEAMLVPPGQPEALAAAWSSLHESTGQRIRLGEASRKRAPDFGIAQAVDTYEETYRRCGLRRAQDAERSIRPEVRRQNGNMAGLDIRPAAEHDRPQILELLGRSLGWENDARHAALFAWKHDANPVGPSPMWVACDEGRIVGLRVFMRWRFRRGDEVFNAARAVDTATDPEYRGKGLFRLLTLHGLDALREEGVDFVFNTPNGMSLPGYLSMGWRVVGRLPASFRPRSVSALATVARSRTPADLWSEPLSVGESIDDWFAARTCAGEEQFGDRGLRTDRSDEFIRWRYADPLLGYRAVRTDQGALILRQRRRGPARELVLADRIGGTQGGWRQAERSSLEVSDCHYLLRSGPADLRSGFVPVPGGGPTLAWKALKMLAMPPRSNWQLTMGDVELF